MKTASKFFGVLFLLTTLLIGSALHAEPVVCDVVVVGGGSAGIVAAAQSARAGAKTILIESGTQLGGAATSGGVNFPGLFHAWGRQVIAGIGWELVEETAKLNGDPLPDFSVPTGRWHWKHQIRVNLPLYAALAEDLCLKSGVEIRYFESPMKLTPLKEQKDGSNWQVLTASQGEERTIHCKQLVDCTGNGALCALAGAQRLREEITQPGTFSYQIKSGIDPAKLDDAARIEIKKRYEKAVADGEIKEGDVSRGIMEFLKDSATNYVYGADNSTGPLRTETNIRGRQAMLRMLKFVRSLPGGENAKLVSMAAEVGVRETWRVKGRYVMTVDDYTSGTVWPDSLAYAFYPIDLHDNKKGVAPAHLKEGTVATIPLRALLPEGVDNMLVAGRCISSDRLANSALRVQATCMSGGQAAGAAAAVAAQQKVAAAAVNIDAVKKILKEHQAVVPEN